MKARLRVIAPVLAAMMSTLALGLASPAPATADGDPASDVLPEQDVFFPYSPPTSNGVARALLQLTSRARAAGWPVKVAIIASPRDLGSVGRFFGRPQAYADLLGAEFGAPRLLVVMPQGFGGQRLGDDFTQALAGLRTGRGAHEADRLALVAMTAVARLAAHNGYPVVFPRIARDARARAPYREQGPVHDSAGAAAPRPTTPAGSADAPARSGGGWGSALWFVGPVALALLALTAWTRVDRRGSGERRPAGPGAGDTGSLDAGEPLDPHDESPAR